MSKIGTVNKNINVLVNKGINTFVSKDVNVFAIEKMHKIKYPAIPAYIRHLIYIHNTKISTIN